MLSGKKADIYLNSEVPQESSVPAFNKHYAIILLLGVVVFFFLSNLTIRYLWIENGRSKNDFAVFILWPVIGLYLMLLCPMVFLRTKPRLAVFDCNWFRWTRSELIRLPLLVIGMPLVVIIVVALARILHLPINANILLWSNHSIVFFIWVTIRTTLLGPVIEEVFWRGYVQGTMARTFRPRTAVLGQALLFGLLHFFSPVLGMVKAFLMGLMFGAWRYKRKTLLPIIIMHVASNSVAVAIGWSHWFATPPLAMMPHHPAEPLVELRHLNCTYTHNANDGHCEGQPLHTAILDSIDNGRPEYDTENAVNICNLIGEPDVPKSVFPHPDSSTL